MRLVRACVLLVFVFSLPTSAQQTGTDQRRQDAHDLWLARSKTITDDLIKDAAELTLSERALLWGRLAQRWWQDDPERSRAWALKSIETVEDVPPSEKPAERNRRLTAARVLLNIVAPLDQKLSQRMIALLSEDTEHSEDAERSANADGLIETALAIVETDPPRAATLGALALRIGRPTQITSLLFGLRSKDAGLADALFVQTLGVARQAMDHQLMNSLTLNSFPELMQPGIHAPKPPDNLRADLLRLDIDYLQANSISAENQNSVCASVASFVAPVLSQFDRLLPEQAVIARQFVYRCQSTSPSIRQRADEALRYQPLKTVDDLLKAADDAQDFKVRTVYFYRAASRAKEQNDLDRALKILDEMSDKAREFGGGTWEAYRWDWAALSAIRHFESGDVSGMRLIINAVPADLQPFAKLAFISRLPAARDRNTDPALEFLDDARTGLRRSTVSDVEKSSWYFGLLQLTVKYQPLEATAVLKETVASLNRAEQAKDKDGGKDQSNSLDTTAISKTLPPVLLEMDEYAVREAVSAITSPQTRAQVRLELLGVCLQRLRNTKPASPGTKTPPSKGE